MNLGDIRTRVLSFRSWDSSGTTFNTRVTAAINTAMFRLASDLSRAFIPSTETITLLADVKGADAAVAAELEATADSRVLRFVDTSGDALGAGTGTGTWTPKIDGTWDGRMHVELELTSGKLARRKCLEFWGTGLVAGAPVAGSELYVSIDSPWTNTTDKEMKFRLVQPEFFVRDDVKEILPPARIWDSTRQQLWNIDAGGAMREDMWDYRGEVSGRPFRMWSHNHFQLPAPTEAPAVVTATGQLGDIVWAGPVQEGDFTFMYTYVHGRRDPEYHTSPEGVIDPVWESSPSPISTSFSHTTNNGVAIQIRPTNIDAMMGFDPIAGELREGHSGLRIRIYVARSAIRTAGRGDAAFDQVETGDHYYLLDEIGPTDVAGGSAATTPSFNWNGSVVPDYKRRHRSGSTGYYGWQVYPHQDAEYTMDVRVLRYPPDLVDDQDAPPIKNDAVPAFLELVLYYMCLLDGVDQSSAELHLKRYDKLAKAVRAHYANRGRIVEPKPLGGYGNRTRLGAYSDEV